MALDLAESHGWIVDLVQNGRPAAESMDQRFDPGPNGVDWMIGPVWRPEFGVDVGFDSGDFGAIGVRPAILNRSCSHDRT